MGGKILQGDLDDRKIDRPEQHGQEHETIGGSEAGRILVLVHGKIRESGTELRTDARVAEMGENKAPARGRRPLGSLVPTGTRIPGFDNGPDSSSRVELSGHDGGHGAAGGDNILQDPVNGIFVEYSQVPVSLDVRFQRLELQAGISGGVTDPDQPEIRLAGPGTDRGEFRDFDTDFIIGELIGERFEPRQLRLETGPGQPVSLTRPCLRHVLDLPLSIPERRRQDNRRSP